MIAIKAVSGTQCGQIASSQKEHFESPFVGEGCPGEAEAVLLCRLGCSGPVRPFSSVHRFIKRRVKPAMGFFSFETAWRTLQGYEVMNMMRKGQVQGVSKGDITGQITFIASLFGVAA